MPATKVPSRIPLGRVSLASLEYVVDPVVRVLYLRNTLDFVQEVSGRRAPGSLSAANAIRNRIEHPHPAKPVPTEQQLAQAAATYEESLRHLCSTSGPHLQKLMSQKVGHIDSRQYRTPPSTASRRRKNKANAREAVTRLYRITRGWEQVATEFCCDVPPDLPPLESLVANAKGRPAPPLRPLLVPGHVSLIAISQVNDPVARLFLQLATLQYVLFVAMDTPPEEEPDLGDMVRQHAHLIARDHHVFSACKLRNALVHADSDVEVSASDVRFASGAVIAAIEELLLKRTHALRATIRGDSTDPHDRRIAESVADLTAPFAYISAPASTDGLDAATQLCFEQFTHEQLQLIARRCKKRLEAIIFPIRSTLKALPTPELPQPTTWQRFRAACRRLWRRIRGKKPKKPKLPRQARLLQQATALQTQLRRPAKGSAKSRTQKKLRKKGRK